MSLDQLFIQYGSDKSSKHHNYSPVYERYFSEIRKTTKNVIELGIGGYDKVPGGGSLKAWRDYFPNAMIHGVDIYDKRSLDNGRIKTFKGSQDDPVFLKWMIEGIGQPDIIIDDASHINPLTIKTFQILWPLLKRGGYYVVEDAHTSYWKENFDGEPNPELISTDTRCGLVLANKTIMNFLKSLTDDLNDHVILEEYKGDYAGQLEWLHFYKEIVVIKKK